MEWFAKPRPWGILRLDLKAHNQHVKAYQQQQRLAQRQGPEAVDPAPRSPGPQYQPTTRAPERETLSGPATSTGRYGLRPRHPGAAG